jgi:hypothetical protein
MIRVILQLTKPSERYLIASPTTTVLADQVEMAMIERKSDANTG